MAPNLALHYIENIEFIFQRVHRTLRREGIFFLIGISVSLPVDSPPKICYDNFIILMKRSERMKSASC